MKVLAYTRSRAVARGFVTVCAAVFVTVAPSVALAAGVVGTGSAASCTGAALDTALAGGGLVTFNCGTDPVTIDISAGTGTKTIVAETTIDGGGLISISGGNSVRVFTVNTGVTFTVQHLTISNGKSTGSRGGGIDNEGGTLVVTDTTFSGNSAVPGPGGGIFNTGTLTVTNSTFSGNSAGVGGGIGNIGTGTLTVTNSTFSGNSAGIGGGGIANGTGTLTVTNSTFSGNSASEAGGGIVNLGTLTVTNSTFSGNSASEVGGGIHNEGSTLTVSNSTFSGNSASEVGGGIDNASGAVTVTNTIVANSTPGGNCSGDAITDGGHNIDDGTTCGFKGTGCSSAGGSSFCSTNPQLDPAGLANNGGPTETIALEPDSPAINAGDPSVCANPPANGVDQRGFARPGIGHTQCSIGAYEADAVPSMVTATPTDTPTTITATPTDTPPTITATPTAKPSCTGDCDGNGVVAINELILGVNIALGSLPVSACPAFENAQGMVDIAQLVQGVGNALNGCPRPPTPSVTVPAGSTPTPTVTPTRTPANTPTVTPTQSGDHFVDNGDGTISDAQTGLIWEKKDQSGGVHDVNSLFPWAGVCTDQNGVPCSGIIGCTLCQPDAAAESTCNAAAGGAVGCARCPGAAICQPINGLTTVWQWLNQINGANFAGHNDWRIPTIGRDGGAVQLETIIDTSVAGCGSGVPCIAPAFNTSCTNGCAASNCSCTDVGQYWSATSVAEVLPLPSVWSVLFFRGTIGGADKTSGFFARAVRSLPCGTFLAKFGSQGSGEGQFIFPQAIAVDHSGNVFVADTDNHRIEKFTNAGSFLLQWGGMGTADGQFDSPHGVAVDGNGNVFVADTNNSRIQKFTNAGTFLGKWGSTGSDDGQFSGPFGLAVDDPSGNLFVADRFNNRIQKFTNAGVFLTKWGSVGDADGQFGNPVGVAVDRTGHEVFVADHFNHRVQKFTDTGAFVAKWGVLGLGEGEFSDLEAITVTADGRVLVTDVDRIQVFTSDGTFITEWGSLGNMDGQFNSAIGIAVDADGNVFVTDENHRVQKFACP